MVRQGNILVFSIVDRLQKHGEVNVAVVKTFSHIDGISAVELERDFWIVFAYG